MRLCQIVLVLAAAFLASSDAARDSKITTFGLPASARLISADRTRILPERFLRTENPADMNDEERGISLKSIPGLEKLTGLFKTKITPGTLVNWANKQESLDYVFLKLKLDKAGSQLFDNPDINLWAAYASAVVKTNPEAAMLTSLQARYTDDVLSKMLEAGEKVKSAESVATKLQTQQMATWLTAKQTPDDVFKTLLLDKAGDGILGSQVLAAWTNYMKFFNSKPENKKNRVTLIATLTAHYKDRGVLRIIEAAKNVPSTATTAKRVEAEQIQLWLKNYRTPDSLLTLLSLDKAGDQLLASPRFQTWSKFIKYYNKESPDEAETVVARLTNHFGDKALTPILVAARKVPKTKYIAAELQAEQFKRWLSTNQLPEDVFKLLQLDKAGDGLLANPQLNNWFTYTKDFNLNVKNADDQASTISVLRDNFDDDVLARMIFAAKKAPSMQSMAQRVQGDLFRGWILNLSSPDGVFKYLKLDEVGENVFQSPLWSMYTTFLGHYNKIFPHRQTTMISAFTRSYDDEPLARILLAAKKVPSTEKLATKLQTDQLQRWLANKDTPEDVFRALMLDNAVDDVLANPLLNTWATYLDAFNAKHPRSKVSMVDTLREFFGDKALVKMLTAAKEVASTKTIATKLEASLINKWILAKKTPASVSKMLGMHETKLLEAYTTRFRKNFGPLKSLFSPQWSQPKSPP